MLRYYRAGLSRNQTKTLLGIETWQLLRTAIGISGAAIKLKPY